MSWYVCCTSVYIYCVCACASERACMYVFVTNSGSACSSVWYSGVENKYSLYHKGNQEYEIGNKICKTELQCDQNLTIAYSMLKSVM